eukprot:tig00021339_g20385.t1
MPQNSPRPSNLETPDAPPQPPRPAGVVVEVTRNPQPSEGRPRPEPARPTIPSLDHKSERRAFGEIRSAVKARSPIGPNTFLPSVKMTMGDFALRLGVGRKRGTSTTRSELGMPATQERIREMPIVYQTLKVAEEASRRESLALTL